MRRPRLPRQAAKLSLEQKQLKAQTDAFFDYLAKRGKLPGQAHALDAAYNPGAGRHGSWYNCRVHNKGVSP